MATFNSCENSTICEELDDLALHILNVMQNLISERQYLDDTLKEGFINMAKSRYYGHKISNLQIKTVDLHASRKVISDLDFIGEVKFSSFQISDSIKMKTGILDVQFECNIENRLSKLKSSKSEEDVNNTFVKDSSNRKTSFTSENPLHWFGVLVPETLKVCQNRFEQVIETCAKVASLQNQLIALVEQYKKLRKRKATLNSV